MESEGWRGTHDELRKPTEMSQLTMVGRGGPPKASTRGTWLFAESGPWPTVQPTDAASRRPQRVHIHTQTYDAKSGSGLRRTGAISALSRRLVGRNKPSRLRLRLSVRKVTIRGMAAVRLAARLIKRPRPSGGLRAGAVNLDGGFLPPKGESGGSTESYPERPILFRQKPLVSAVFCPSGNPVAHLRLPRALPTNLGSISDSLTSSAHRSAMAVM